MKFLEVSNSVLIEGENGNFYKVSFTPCTFHPVNGKTLYTSGQSVSRLFNDGKQPEVGTVYSGEIKKFNTTEYPVGKGTDEKMVTTLSIAVFEDEEAEDLAFKQLARNGATLINASGKEMVNPYAKEEEITPAPKAKAGNKPGK